MSELDVAFRDDHLERAVVAAEPDRRDKDTPVSPVRRQHGRRGILHKRAHAREPILCHTLNLTRDGRNRCQAVADEIAFLISAAGAIVAALSVLLIPGRGREFAAEVHAEAALSA